jgi:hypothetical protein
MKASSGGDESNCLVLCTVTALVTVAVLRMSARVMFVIVTGIGCFGYSCRPVSGHGPIVGIPAQVVWAWKAEVPQISRVASSSMLL